MSNAKTATYYKTSAECTNYELLDGTQLRAYQGYKGGRVFETTKDGKTRKIKNEYAYLATVNNDVRQRLLPQFQAAHTPEEICAVSQLMWSEKGRTKDVDFEEIYRTPDGRKYRVVRSRDVGDSAITEWGYVDGE